MRADLALGDLPVVLEPVVGQPGGARQDARAAVDDDFERDGVQGGDVVEGVSPRLRRANPLARAAHRLADRDLRSAHAARREQRRKLGGSGVVPGKRENSRARLQMRDDRLERPAVER